MATCDVIKNCLNSSRQHKRRKCKHFSSSRKKCSEYLPPSFTYYVELFLKLGISLLIGPVENCSLSSSVVNIIQKLFGASDEGFKTASGASLPRPDIFMVFKFWVIWWPLFFFNNLQTVLMEALLTDTCNVHRAPCILPNLLLHLAAVGRTCHWIRKQKLIHNFNYCLQKHQQ